jgi:hypothetical protein
MQLRLVLAVLAAAMLQSSAYAALPTTAESRQAAVAAPAEQPSADQGDKPNFPPQTFPLRGDTFDPWCKGVTTAINVALCGDDELRALAVQRLQAFDVVSRRLTQEQRKALAGDQNGWAMSYPQGCGLPSNVPPSLPLAQATRECLAKAGRERLTYLQAYGSPTAGSPTAGSNPPAASEQTAPGSQPAAASPAAAPQPAMSQLTPAARQPLAAQLPVTDLQSSAPTAPPAPPTASKPPASGAPVATASASTAETPASSQPPQPTKGSTGNPLASRVTSLGTLQGKAAFAIALIAVLAVGIWIGGARRQARARTADRGGAETRG